MKRIFYILVLLVSVSCTKDDDGNSMPAIAADEIPANRKFISKIDRPVDDVDFAYDDDGKIIYIYLGYQKSLYDISYSGNHIDTIKFFSNIYPGAIYQFIYDDFGALVGCQKYNITNYQPVSYQPINYDSATKSYDGWLFMYDDGSVRRVVDGNTDQTLIYDYTKRGAFTNSNQELIKFLLMVNKSAILWPAFIGKHPCKQIVQQQGVFAIENTYDSQGFISTSHMDSSPENLDSFYTYIQI